MKFRMIGIVVFLGLVSLGLNIRFRQAHPQPPASPSSAHIKFYGVKARVSLFRLNLPEKKGDTLLDLGTGVEYGEGVNSTSGAFRNGLYVSAVNIAKPESQWAVCKWEIIEGKRPRQIASLRLHGRVPADITLSPDTRYTAFSDQSEDGTVCLLDWRKQKVKLLKESGGQVVHGSVISCDNEGNVFMRRSGPSFASVFQVNESTGRRRALLGFSDVVVLQKGNYGIRTEAKGDILSLRIENLSSTKLPPLYYTCNFSRELSNGIVENALGGETVCGVSFASEDATWWGTTLYRQHDHIPYFVIWHHKTDEPEYFFHDRLTRLVKAVSIEPRFTERGNPNSTSK